MRINAISSTYRADYKHNNVSQNFTGLIKDASALPIIKSMPKADILEFEQIEKRLSKTKFWDMKIAGIGDKFRELKFYFINKKDTSRVITDGIYPYNVQGNTIRTYSIFYGPENSGTNMVETLNFKSEERANELYNKYKQDSLYIVNRGYNVSPIESIKFKESELNMLEEAAELERGNKDKNILFTEYGTKAKVGNEFRFTDLPDK